MEKALHLSIAMTKATEEAYRERIDMNRHSQFENHCNYPQPICNTTAKQLYRDAELTLSDQRYIRYIKKFISNIELKVLKN